MYVFNAKLNEIFEINKIYETNFIYIHINIFIYILNEAVETLKAFVIMGFFYVPNFILSERIKIKLIINDISKFYPPLQSN